MKKLNISTFISTTPKLGIFASRAFDIFHFAVYLLSVQEVHISANQYIGQILQPQTYYKSEGLTQKFCYIEILKDI